MVVDDEPDIVRKIKQFLQKYGFNVSTFTDPKIALDYFKKNPTGYYLVISDVRMPGMNGFEFARKVREIRPDVKLILMTAFEINPSEIAKVMPHVKVDDFFQKPASKETVYNKVKKLIAPI